VIADIRSAIDIQNLTSQTGNCKFQLPLPFTGHLPSLIGILQLFIRKNFENSKSFLNIAADFRKNKEPDGRI
jgi:hypothetical protein